MKKVFLFFAIALNFICFEVNAEQINVRHSAFTSVTGVFEEARSQCAQMGKVALFVSVYDSQHKIFECSDNSSSQIVVHHSSFASQAGVFEEAKAQCGQQGKTAAYVGTYDSQNKIFDCR